MPVLLLQRSASHALVLMSSTDDDADGTQVEEGHDYCVITPPKALKSGVDIDTYDDHRMAMAFSLAACGDVAVTINDPGCTRKTFPTYFTVFNDVVEYK